MNVYLRTTVLPNLPRTERHVYGADIRAQLDMIQRLIITVHKRHHKQTTLRDLDVAIAQLRGNLEVGADPKLKLLTPKKLEVAGRHLQALGAMTGAWLKAERDRERGR